MLRLFLYFYFVFSSGVENRTLSQMCGRLHMQIFLLRVGLLTDVYCFFYDPGHIFPLTAYNLEVVHCCCVGSGVLMIKYW